MTTKLVSIQDTTIPDSHGEIRLAVSVLDAVLGEDLKWSGPGSEALQECLDGKCLPGLPWPRRFDQLSAIRCEVLLDDTKFDRVLSIFADNQSSADQHLAQCRDALAAGTLLHLCPINIKGRPGSRLTGRYLHEIQ